MKSAAKESHLDADIEGVQTTMIYTHVARKNALGVTSPLDSVIGRQDGDQQPAGGVWLKTDDDRSSIEVPR